VSFYKRSSNHQNKTERSLSKSTSSEADKLFPAAKKKDQPEFNARLYRENEEREWEKKIAALRQLRLQHESANAPIKEQRKQRGRPSKRRIPEAV
jgi:hypothetical protein